MRKNILTFGIIAGLIVSIFMVVSIAICYSSGNFGEGSMEAGYASMIIAFSFIVVAIKNFRDKYNNGVISFGKAFQIGLFISLIASTFYVVTWLIYFYNFVPDFMDKYGDLMIKQASQKGLSALELQKETEKIAKMREMYKNPLFVILFTYVEVLPVGLLVTVVASLILKKKSRNIVQA